MAQPKITEVAENHNWIDRVNSEIRSQLSYASEWGATLKQKLPPTVEDQIEAKVAELEEAKAQVRDAGFSTTSTVYGNGKTLERFGVAGHGKRRMHDLMAQPKEK